MDFDAPPPSQWQLSPGVAPPRRQHEVRIEPARATRPGAGGNPSWAATTIFSCLVIGLLAGWIHFERAQLKAAKDQNDALKTSLVLNEGRTGDIGKLVADPRTQVVRLSGSETSPVHTATIAWNDSQQRGVLFCDLLPPLDAGSHYSIWGIVDHDAPKMMANIDAQPGVSAYPFRPVEPLGHVSAFAIRNEGTSANNRAILSGTIQ